MHKIGSITHHNVTEFACRNCWFYFIHIFQESAHPGVGNLPLNIPPNPREDTSGQVTLHAYYQWVPIVLVLQAAIYYLPELLWKQVDHGFFITTICKLNEVHINEGAADEVGARIFFIDVHSLYANYKALSTLSDIFW